MEIINATIGWVLPCTTLDETIDCISEVPMYIGLAIAITGFVLSIICGLGILWTIAFGGLGIVCGLGLYHARRSRLLQELQMKIQGLNDSLKTMESIRDRLTRTYLELKAQVLNLENKNREFEETNRKFQETNREFEQKNIEFQKRRDELEQSNLQFQEENKRLNSHISNFHSEVTNLTSQISSLTRHNTELEKNVSELTKTKEDLEKVKNELHKNNLRLTSQIQTLNGVAQKAEQLLSNSQQNLEALQNERSEFMGEVGHHLDEKIAELSGNLSIIAATIKDQTKKTGQLYNEMSQRLPEDIKDSFEKIGNEFLTAAKEHSVETLTVTRQQLLQTKRELEAVERKIQEANQQYTLLLVRNERATSRLEQTQERMSTVQEKIEERVQDLSQVVSQASNLLYPVAQTPQSMGQALNHNRFNSIPTS